MLLYQRILQDLQFKKLIHSISICFLLVASEFQALSDLQAMLFKLLQQLLYANILCGKCLDYFRAHAMAHCLVNLIGFHPIFIIILIQSNEYNVVFHDCWKEHSVALRTMQVISKTFVKLRFLKINKNLIFSVRYTHKIFLL